METLIAVGIIVYFAPSIVASFRRVDRLAAIVALNFFLGWTFIGWVIALVWALAEKPLPEPDFQPQLRTAPAQPAEARSASAFCTKCGNALEDGARFCGKCGTPVAA